jgi:SAM-dependent methyltransferase
MAKTARFAGLAGGCFGWRAGCAGLRRQARKKAKGAGTEIDFQMESAEALPFSEATFDVVLSTTVFHCLSDRARHLCIHEMARVLKPNGRLLLIDFGGSKRERRSPIGHLRAHRDFDVFDLIPTINETGLTDLKNGSLGFSDLQFLIATRLAARPSDPDEWFAIIASLASPWLKSILIEARLASTGLWAKVSLNPPRNWRRSTYASPFVPPRT